MKDFPGTPGTFTALTLRVLQFSFAAGSIVCITTTPGFFEYTALCYLIASMGLQVIWSFGLALFDAKALITKKVLHNLVLVSLFAIGDWVTGMLSLAAASASAGLLILYFRDLGKCQSDCLKYWMSITLAFMSWENVEISLPKRLGERTESDGCKVTPKVLSFMGKISSRVRIILSLRFKPHFLMVMTQVGYAFLYFITEASFNHGLNPYVYITYRHIVSGFAVLPFAYFLERKVRPKLTLALFAEIFVLSLLGVSLTLNMYFASLKYTSPTFLASMVNTIASLTLIIAVVLRLEVIDIKSIRGVAKVLGTIVSLAGVMTMTLYRGPAVKNLWSAIIHIGGNSRVQENWLKGSVLVVASCITWSMWYIMQAITLKRYPAPLSLTTWMSFVGASQSAVFTVIVQHKPKPWAIGFNIDLWAIIYSGVVCSGLIVFIQLWCTEKKGPVFVTMFNPVSTVLVAVLAYFILGERLYMGSIIGGVIVIFGLYTVLWGKEGDKELQTELQAPSSSSDEEQKETKIQISSMEVVKSEEKP